MTDKPIVLITGASGNIGRSLASALQERYFVIGLDRSSGDTDYPVLEADLTDEASIADALARIGSEHGRRIASVVHRSEEHTSELQSLMRISYAVFCLKKKNALTNKQSTIVLTLADVISALYDVNRHTNHNTTQSTYYLTQAPCPLTST